MGRQAVALRYSQEAIRQAGLLGDRRSNALAIHANILRGMGRIAESRQFLKLASEAAPDATRGHSLTTLAQLELAEGNFDAARAACLESCRLWESTNGHPSYLGNALAILSRIEAAVGDSSASERLARRALAIFEESLGQNHPRVVTALADLAECVKERRPDEAGRLLERAMRIAREKLGENHQEAIALALALADIERRTGRPEEAWKLYDWSLRGARTAFGPSSSRIAPYLNNAAIALMDLARYSEAEQLFREALQVREAELGPMHVSSAETLYNLGVVLARRLEMGEARKFVERSLAVRQMHYGEDHPSMLPGLELYGRLLLGAGEKRRARSVRHRMETLAASDPEMRHKVDVKALQSAFR
jgi:tetratricopeptide (TPR) repeat protein